MHHDRHDPPMAGEPPELCAYEGDHALRSDEARADRAAFLGHLAR